MNGYQVIEHTADIGIRSFGGSEKEAFENSAAGMFSLITDLQGVEQIQVFNVAVEAEDLETLLVEWLNELLYIFESNDVLLSGFSISEMDETRLRAIVSGEPLDETRHELRADIKAVTYHLLKVEKTAAGWKTEVIFDV